NAVRLGLAGLRQTRHAERRRRVDPGRQRADDQGLAATRIPRLQDLPRLRQAAVNVFVTGGTGFVGAHLVKALCARGDSVTALVRKPALAARLGWDDAVRLQHGDLDDEAALRAGCAGADVVYHVAGKIAARNAAEFMATNRDGTANVLEAARDAGARRLLFVSSLAVAGPTTPGHPIDESRPPQPVTDYGRSKHAAEVLVRAMPPSLPWTIVRPPVVYGEWDRGTLKIFQLARRGVVPVFGDGSQELSVIHAEDLARSLIAAATSPAAVGRVYFAAHPTATTSRGRNWSVSESLWRGFTAIDLATGAYVAVATGAVLLSFRGDGIPGWPWILTAHTLIAALVLLAPRARSTGPLGRFLGDWYPML